MRKNRLRVYFLLLPILLFLSKGNLLAANFKDLKVGQTAPDFTLKDWSSEQNEVNLGDFKGEKVVVLLFASSTSWPYVEQVVSLEDLVKRQDKDNVEFLTIYVREENPSWQPKDYFEREQRAKALRFQMGVQTHLRMKQKVLIDEMDDRVFKAYGEKHNSAFIIDRDGKIFFKTGVVKVVDLDEQLRKLLQQ